MWANSDWLVERLPDRVLSDLNFKLVLGLTGLNVILWLTSTILQFILVGQLDSSTTSSSILLGISAGWSLLNLTATTGSIYGVYRNTIKEIRAYLVLTAVTGLLSLLIFIFHVITLSMQSADERWLSPGGFSIFTGFYVFGESCIICVYVFYLWKELRSEMEEAKMDRLRRMIQQEQEQQLETLNQSVVPIQTNETYDEIEVDVHAISTISNHLETSYESFSDDQESDRITYYPPVFV